MRYPVVLLDLDHTLFDSDESERLAYAHTMQLIGLERPDHHFARYVDINRQMWAAVEAGTMQPVNVRLRRFEQFNAELGLDADPHVMAEAFVWGLAEFGELYEGAVDVIAELADHSTLAMVTNGLSDVQRRRIERLDLAPYFHTVIVSSEVGVTKPRPEIFDLAFAGLGDPDRSGALMVGDSLTSDIAGGRNAGIDTCWYNPHGRVGDGSAFTHEIRSLTDLESLIR